VHNRVQEAEGLHAIAILPVSFKGNVIACMNITSHTLDEIPPPSRVALETVAAQIGGAIRRFQSEEALARQNERLRISEEALRTEREQLEEITATLPGVVYQFYARPDGSMGLYYVSSRAPEVFGMSGDLETFFERFSACVDPRDRGAFLESISSAVKCGKPWHFEGRFIHASGREIWFEGNSRPVLHGDELVFSGILSDITARKQAESELFESREKYRIIVETADEGIWAIDDQFRTVFTNRRMREIFGYSTSEMLGRPVWDFVPPDEADSMKQELLGRRSGKTGRYERAWVRKDGTLVWCMTSGTPLFSREGTFLGSFGVFTDITERRRTEAALRESEERLQLALDGGELGTWYWNVQSGDVAFSRRWAGMLGYSVDELEPNVRSWEQLVHPDDLPRVREILQSHIEGKSELYECEHRLRHKNGSWIWVLDKGKVIRRDAGGRPLFAAGTHLDITRRKQAEEALAEANRRTKLLNSMTRHDVLNQLLALRGFTQVAAKQVSDPVLAGQLAKIQAIGETITNQVEFTRAYQELGLNVPGWLRLDDVITRTAGSIPVRNAETCHGIEVFCDPMLERVFFNLFENASRHGKHVTEIHVSCRQEGDALLIVVEDNGIGVPAADKEKIFDRGFGKNTGLGLFLSKEILAITGITIRESGEPEKGARFEMVVPKGVFRDSACRTA
jgi:PAS domain S-box-containing protein